MNIARATRLDVDAEVAARSLDQFTTQAWGVVETTPLVWGKHLDAICQHLQAVTSGQIRNLLICIPPRHTKSTLVSVMWPAWTWINRKGNLRGPKTKFLCSSYAHNLAIRDSVACRALIESNWYKQYWGNDFQLSLDQNQKSRFQNTRRGERVAVGVGGSATGEGGDILIIDDPHNVRQAESTTIRQGVIEWYDRVWSTRQNDPRRSAQVVICQRVNELDLVGHLLEIGDWEQLMLPTEYEGSKYTTSIGWRDTRRKVGQLLCPERFGPQEVAHAKYTLGSYAYAAQHQQRPAPLGGGVIKEHWWRYWQPVGSSLPPVEVRNAEGGVTQIPAVELPAGGEQFQSWDMAFKDTRASAYVCGQAWLEVGSLRFLLDQLRGKWDFVRTLAAVVELTGKWPKATAKLIEDKANGPAVMAALKGRIDGMIPVEPYGSKTSRAVAVSPVIEAGDVYLPHPALAAWIEQFIGECSVFPAGLYNDQVDTMTQALSKPRTQLLDLPPIYSAMKLGLRAEI